MKMKFVLKILIVPVLFFQSCICGFSQQYISPAILIRPYKDITLRIWVVNKMKNQYQGLSLEDKYVVKKYVAGAVKGENTFQLINANLRGNLKDYINPKDINKPLQARLKFYIDSLEKTMNKPKLPQNTILYYGVSDSDVKIFFGAKQININTFKNPSESGLAEVKVKLSGYKFLEKGFMLASYDKNNINKTNVRFEIKAPKNLQGLLIEQIGIGYEKKVLINKNINWEVERISLEKDKSTYYYNIRLKYCNK